MNDFDTVRERLIIEYDEGDDVWLTLWPDGTITADKSPARAIARIRATARKTSRSHDIVLSTIEWRNVPDGFVPPK
jgi:hypothetical protein